MLSLSLHVVQACPPVSFLSRPSAVAWEKGGWTLPLQRVAKEQQDRIFPPKPPAKIQYVPS